LLLSHYGFAKLARELHHLALSQRFALIQINRRQHFVSRFGKLPDLFAKSWQSGKLAGC